MGYQADLSRGNETQMVVMNMMFLLMALFVAWAASVTTPSREPRTLRSTYSQPGW